MHHEISSKRMQKNLKKNKERQRAAPLYDHVDTVGRNKEKIAQYIRNQLQEDVAAEQLLFKEYIDPFTGSKNSKA